MVALSKLEEAFNTGRILSPKAHLPIVNGKRHS